MTLKGSNFDTKNDTTTIHNPVGVEFFKKHCRAQGMPCAYEDTRVNQSSSALADPKLRDAQGQQLQPTENS